MSWPQSQQYKPNGMLAGDCFSAKQDFPVLSKF